MALIPPIIFLLLQLFLLLKSSQTAAQDCPNGCDCLPDVTLPSALSVNCQWEQIPSGNVPFPPNTRSLHLECRHKEGTTSPSDTDHQGLFAAVPELHSLRIEGCQHFQLSSLKNLSALRSLHLSQISAPGVSLSVPEDFFTNLPKLEKLHISEANLELLPQKIFCQLSKLMVLNVSSNWLSEDSLNFDQNCPSKLIIVDLSDNKIRKLDSTSLSFFPVVRQLSLARNKIKSVAETAFSINTFLQQLDLESNEIDNLSALPETLIYANLAHNELRTIPKTLASLPKLLSLNVSHNAIDHESPSALLSSELESLDLSHNRLGKIPRKFFANSVRSLVHLHLQHNRINDIAEEDLKNMTKLQTLNLGSNNIQQLRDETFMGLADLSQLMLSNNSLESIELSALADLTIAELDLSKNLFTEVPLAVGSLLKLRKLDLSHNKISKLFVAVFNKSPHLHAIDLSHNKLQSINSYEFADCPHLSNIDLSHNAIGTILKDSFIKSPLLRRVDLSHNRLTHSFEEAIGQIIGLRRLNLTYNHIEILQWESFPDKLDVLHADENRITLLGAAIKSKVRIASLRNNLIEQLSEDQLPNTLEVIDLYGNRIKSIANETMRRKSSLKSINIEKNSLEDLRIEALRVENGLQPYQISLRDNPLKCTCNLDWIRTPKLSGVMVVDAAETFCRHAVDGRKIQLSAVEHQDLLCPYEADCLPGCICCQFARCDCSLKCPSGCRCYKDSTFSTNIVRCEGQSGNPAEVFKTERIPMSATHVVISNVNVPHLKKHALIGRNKLVHLHINGTNLEHIEQDVFKELANLQLLDLSNNRLVQLTGKEFYKTPKVTHLFLNGNRLRFFESGLSEKMPNLKLVTLHNNLLEDLTPALKNSASLLSVSLSGNPFRCDCGDRYTAPLWMFENKDKIVDYSKVFCVENVTKAFRENDTTILSAYPPNIGDDIFTMPIDDFVRESNRSICYNHATGLFGIEPQSSILLSLLILACLILALGLLALGVAVVKRTHTVISQRRYKASSSLNCSSTTPGSSPLPVPLISFDAFVSYAKKDEKMVGEQICRPLEEDDYHMCLLHRDGPVYNNKVHTISDELIAQMDAAQCLILVLTVNFLENEWRTLQIKTSHQLFARNRAKRVIVVLGDGVDPNTLDDELGQILRKSERIYMRDHLFWNLLRAKLPLRSPNSASGSQIYSDLYGPVPSEMV